MLPHNFEALCQNPSRWRPERRSAGVAREGKEHVGGGQLTTGPLRG
jgi:hypothetical protein